jgi:hypothetical protein
MSYMVFPDGAQLRASAEITFRTILADWYSTIFAEQNKQAQARLIRRIGSKLGDDLPRARTNPSEWIRNRIFNDFLRPAGGVSESALLLTTSPSAAELSNEWTRRWWPIVYTGKLLALIGSIHQHHREVGARVNKAIHILCKTEGDDEQLTAAFRQSGFPGVYESSLKKAWAKFRPVAHLCAAYVTTETHFYEEQLSRDFWEYWKEPPAFYNDEVFGIFCLIAKSVERFATSFYPRAQLKPLIPSEEIFALRDEFSEPSLALPGFRPLTNVELAALNTYRAPKQLA